MMKLMMMMMIMMMMMMIVYGDVDDTLKMTMLKAVDVSGVAEDLMLMI